MHTSRDVPDKLCNHSNFRVDCTDVVGEEIHIHPTQTNLTIMEECQIPVHRKA
jgi:hypothetical protein